MTSRNLPVFHNLKAWFSNSVPREKKLSWKKHGGREVFAMMEANFIFTSDGSCPDTLSIFESQEFLLGFLSIFHASYIDACLNKSTAHKVAAAKYVVLPPDMSDDIHMLAFVESTGLLKSSHSREQASTSKENSGRDTQQSKSLSTDAGPSCSHSKGFVGGLEVEQSDVDFNTDNLDSIPHVNSMPRYEGEICDFIPGVNGFSVSLKPS